MALLTDGQLIGRPEVINAELLIMSFTAVEARSRVQNLAPLTNCIPVFLQFWSPGYAELAVSSLAMGVAISSIVVATWHTSHTV